MVDEVFLILVGELTCMETLKDTKLDARDILTPRSESANWKLKSLNKFFCCYSVSNKFTRYCKNTCTRWYIDTYDQRILFFPYEIIFICLPRWTTMRRACSIIARPCNFPDKKDSFTFSQCSVTATGFGKSNSFRNKLKSLILSFMDTISLTTIPHSSSDRLWISANGVASLHAGNLSSIKTSDKKMYTGVSVFFVTNYCR